ncbi:MAG: thiamine pyrophosphate-dependent enzyme [Bacillota bacterium]|nr:thiamine pyrophosphate-dependent enzyme [Bacillota bacterium]MDW7684785.1 thiamine pyrophosphate-dependent enzyme [Bacillota bacterium]
MQRDYLDYLREEKLPQMWCSGCSHGISLAAIARAMASLQLNPAETVVVTGIGCWGKADDYFRTHVFHGTHGRALSFATGIKVAKPRLKVLVLMGDGDGVTIGGNHFIHTARRNIDVTAIIANNYNYGMTGGQYSASTPEGSVTTTSRFGTPEPGFDLCELAKVSGATFVARATPYHVTRLEQLLAEAIAHRGFSLVEIVSSCPTYFARYNHQVSAVEMMRLFKEKSLDAAKYNALPTEKRAGYILTGKLHQVEAEDFHSKYALLQKRAAKVLNREG